MYAVRANRLIIAVIALLSVGTSVQAYFEDIGIGARPLGMGGAFVAAADDGNAVLWNAAGLAQLNRQEIIAMFAALYVGLGAKLYNEETDQFGYHFVGYVYPSEWCSFALSWSTFQSHFYDENTFCLSFSKSLKEYLYAGLNLKRAGWSIEGNEYTRLDKDIPDRGTSRNGITFDFSALCKATRKFSIGLSAENLLPADVGLNVKENIPVNLRAGVAYKMDNPANLSMKLLSALDVTYRAGDGTNVRMGLEGWFFDDAVGARAGWNLTSATFGLSYRVTMRRLETQIDYAFVYPISVQETYGSHRMSVSVRF